MSETTNSPSGGSDSARPSISLDEAANINFDDPPEDNVKGEQEQPQDVETDEAEIGQETDETTAADDDVLDADEGEGADDTANPEPEDTATVTVNGEKVALSDLKAGYMRQADYSRKTQEVATGRRDLEALTARVSTSVHAIVDFLSQQIPEAPDPSLAMTNPGEYVQRRAMHEQAMANLDSLIQQANVPKGVADHLTSEQRTELLQSENAKLIEAIPSAATEEGRAKFFQRAASTAKELGYSPEDIAQVTDHRTFLLAHYAAIGLQAEKAKAKVATKVANVPPVTTQRRPQGPSASRLRQNQEAVKRLSRTGSIEDALAIDWE